ncbi:MAG: amidohydrolase family protein [Actinobacteria bacterium]|nr:amidohydrolase family protein [Actinomycetota bacterium]
MNFDLVIRNGSVIDGTGSLAVVADVAVSGGLIARIGEVSERGQVEIDASGYVVTPGFIDGHTHMDAQVFWDAAGTNSCWHGVTTVVMGNCGFTIAPVRADGHHLAVRSIERSEDISAAAMAAGVPWDWTTFAEYLDSIERAPKAINYASNIGHSALRSWAMGERAFHEKADEADLDCMKSELADALRAGAWGFTTSRTVHHMTPDGDPVASRLAEWSEVEELIDLMGDLDAGVFQFVEDPPSDVDRAARDQQLAELAARSGVPFIIGATSGSTRPLELIAATRSLGGTMTGMTHPRGIGTMSSFKSQLPFDTLPEWVAARADGQEAFFQRLREPDTRHALIEAARNARYSTTYGGEARPPVFERMHVLESPVPPHRTVAEVAAERGIDPVEAMVDLGLESNFEVFFVQTMSPFDEVAVLRSMKSPGTVMTFSDSGAHVSQMSDASIFTHLLAYWVRERGEFSIEEAIQMMTSAPAQAWGFTDRGVLREGMAADINVFDPDTVAPELPTLAHDLPAGARRIVQKSMGFLATIVAGEVTLRDGQSTGATPGRLLRGHPRSENGKVTK